MPKKRNAGAETKLKNLKESFSSFEELIPADQLWQALAKSTPNYVYLVDRSGRVVFFNRPSFGYKPEDIIGQEAASFLPKEYQEIVRKAFRRCLKTGLPQDYETEFKLKSEKRLWFASHVSPIRIRGKIISLLVTSTDVTKKKQSEEELQKIQNSQDEKIYFRTVELQKANESLRKEILRREAIEEHLELEKERMEQIYNNTHDGLALYDQNEKVIYCNPAHRHLFSVKKNILGVPRTYIATHQKEFFKYEMERSDDSLDTQRLVYSGIPVTNVMIKFLSKPPRFVEGNYIPIKDKDKKVIGMIASFRDVTTLKMQSDAITQNLAEVKQEKDRWQAIVETVEEGIVVLDQEMKIQTLNPAAELMAGVSEKEAIGKFAHEIFHCHDNFGHYYPEFYPVGKVYQALEAIPYDEHLHTDSDGEERWMGVSYTPVFNDEGKLVQCICVNRDITALKELEAAKSEFVSIASHELRTPLTIVNGYLSLLLNGDLGKITDSKSQLNYLNVISKVFKETKRLTFLVEELLNVSRIEEGRIKLHLRRDRLDQLISEVVSELTPVAASQKITLEADLDIACSQTQVMIDRDKIKQVLVNLIDNAIKYNRESGQVRISTKKSNSHLEVCVEDTGIGIPADLETKIFSKFQQAPGSYLKENKGTGLGLFIVKSLVELHNGKISVHSSPGIGSRFSFSLPVAYQK